MLRELMEDNKALTANMREADEVADKNDSATTSLLENLSTRPNVGPGSCSRQPGSRTARND
jgi:hypothetical protein